jgi:SnoaL-like domain
MIAHDATFPSARDYLEVVDALHRFGSGVDHGDATLLATVFHEDAIVDFGPCGQKLGLDFPLMTGGGMIVGFLAATAATQITTHVVSNGRVEVEGDTAKLRALVDATHLPRTDQSRRCRMMNWYDVELVRDGANWRIRRLVIDNAWFSGDPHVLLGR